MKLNAKAEVFIPFGGGEKEAFSKPTPLVIAAHQDDIEIMAQHGALTCFDNPKSFFSAVVCTDGAGSPRTGIYADYTNEEMMELRKREQKKAATVGDYAFLALLGFPSGKVKDGKERALNEDVFFFFNYL